MVKIFVSAKIASEKYLYFGFLSRMGLGYARERLFLRCLAKVNLRKAAFEGQKKEKLWRWHQNGFSIASQQARPESILPNRSIVVTCIAGPASRKFQLRLSGVSHPVSHVPWDIMKASRRHPLRPGASRRVHQNEHSFAFNAAVVLCALALHVEVTVRHEIFIADCARLDHGGAPKQSAFRSVGNGRDPLNSVNDPIQIHVLELGLIPKEPLHLPERFHALAHIGAGKVAVGPINAGKSAHILGVHRDDGSSTKSKKSTSCIRVLGWSFSLSRGITLPPRAKRRFGFSFGGSKV